MSESEVPIRGSAEIDNRIARLAIRRHYITDQDERYALLSAAAALYWVTDPTCSWAEAFDMVEQYTDSILTEDEGLTP